jgi:hypothetical protein
LRDNKNLAGSNISSPPHSKKNMKAFWTNDKKLLSFENNL